MDGPSPSICDLARRLLTSSRSDSKAGTSAGVLVSENLRHSLTRFAGADGFQSLQRRALVLASAEKPELKRLTVGEGGRLEGWEALVADGNAANADQGPALALTAHLLELLVTFIGEPLMLKLVRESWPNEAFEESNSTSETES